MKYRRRKLDANQAEIVAALRAIGCSVVDLSAVGGGTPDVLAGLGGRNWLLEIKNPKRIGKKAHGTFQVATAEKQATFLERWRGQVATVSTVDEALAAVKS